MRPFTLILVTFGLATQFACTENQRARNFGGKTSVTLPCNQKLFDVTWKDDSLWYVSRAMREGETAETYTFVEDSSFGVFEGEVIFTERRCR